MVKQRQRVGNHFGSSNQLQNDVIGDGWRDFQFNGRRDDGQVVLQIRRHRRRHFHLAHVAKKLQPYGAGSLGFWEEEQY